MRERRLISIALAAWLLPLTLGCEGSTLEPPPQPVTDPSRIYAGLRLNHHAVTLSTPATPPYDTLTLTATPQNSLGEPMTEVGTAEFRSTALDVVQVGVDGILRAVTPGLGIVVYASLTVDGVTHQDSLRVDVVEGAVTSPLTTFVLQLVPPDSARIGADGTYQTAVQARDAAGNTLALPTHFASSDPTVASIDERSGVITSYLPGLTTIYASTTAFGVAKADTLPIRVGLAVFWPVVLNAAIPGRLPSPRLGVGSTILFENQSATESVALTFTGPAEPTAPDSLAIAPNLGLPYGLLCTLFAADCNGGNISTPIPPGGFALRTFPSPGVYDFQSEPGGLSGGVVVIDESQ